MKAGDDMSKQGTTDAMVLFGLKTAGIADRDYMLSGQPQLDVDPELLRKIKLYGDIAGHGFNGALGAYEGVRRTPAGESKLLHGVLSGGMAMGSGALSHLLLQDLKIPGHPLLSSMLRLGGSAAAVEGGSRVGGAAASSLHRIINKSKEKHAPSEKLSKLMAKRCPVCGKLMRRCTCDEHTVDVGGPKGIEMSEKKSELNKLAAKLTTKARNAIPTGSFAEPGERKYPIEDKNHARNALARVSQHGTTAEKKQVRAAVHAKYPDIGEKTSEVQKLALNLAPLTAALKTPAAQQMLRGAVVPGLVGAGIGGLTGGASGALEGGLLGAAGGAAYAGAPALHNHLMTGANGNFAAGYRDMANQLQGVKPPLVTPAPKMAALAAFGLGGWGN